MGLPIYQCFTGLVVTRSKGFIFFISFESLVLVVSLCGILVISIVNTSQAKWLVLYASVSIIYIFGQSSHEHQKFLEISTLIREKKKEKLPTFYINQRKKERKITHHCHYKKTRLKYPFI
jgi:hypothetical protein